MMTDYINNFWIDTIQNAKKTVVDTWIKDDTMNKPLNEFITAQTEFTKTAFKSFSTFTNAYGEAMAKVMK